MSRSIILFFLLTISIVGVAQKQILLSTKFLDKELIVLYAINAILLLHFFFKPLLLQKSKTKQPTKNIATL
jgi:hypothetical protein